VAQSRNTKIRRCPRDDNLLLGVTTLERSALSVLPDFAIDRHRHIFVRLDIAKLHHLVFLARQFAPIAGLFGILFDGSNTRPFSRN
jgi:hypothetical protein